MGDRKPRDRTPIWQRDGVTLSELAEQRKRYALLEKSARKAIRLINDRISSMRQEDVGDDDEDDAPDSGVDEGGEEE